MRNELLVPVAIVFAGLVLAIAVYQIHHATLVYQSGNPDAVLPVNPSTDHILGNPSAPIVIIEYADIDSEYSKDFQQVMEQVMQEYGANGQVAWVYREFPLINVDSDSEENAEAAECVGSLGGTNDFFSFINTMEADAPADSQFDPSGYDAIVTSLGLSSGTFDECLSSHTYKGVVETDLENAGAIGATGAPTSVVLVKGQKSFTISGEIPYASMKQIIDTALLKVS